MPKTPRDSRDPHERIRKLGEHEETVTIKLTQMQIEDKRAEACNLRDQVDALEDKLKSVKGDFKAKQEILEEQERAARRMASTGRADVELIIEEWLTRSNEVVRIDAATGEEIGQRRTARASELQEQLFPADAPEKKAKTGAKDDFPVEDAFGGT